MKLVKIKERYCELRKCACGVEYMYREQVDGKKVNKACPICNGFERDVLKVYGKR